MPGLGTAAAFLTGWNQADDAEKDRRIEEMRVLTSGARDLSTAVSQQSSMNREEQLFPDLLKGQQLGNRKAGVAIKQAESDLRVSEATAPTEIELENLQLSVAKQAYERGEIDSREYMSSLQRMANARRRFAGVTGNTPEDLQMLKEAGPGFQIQAGLQQNLYEKGAANQALQTQYSTALIQSKIDNGLAPYEAQAEVMAKVNASNLLAYQGFAARQKAYLSKLPTGASNAAKAGARMKVVTDLINDIGKIDAMIGAIKGKMTTEEMRAAGHSEAFITTIGATATKTEAALEGLEMNRQAMINTLRLSGINYYSLIQPPSEAIQSSPAISPEALLDFRHMYDPQVPGSSSTPGTEQIPGVMNLPGVGTPSPAQSPAPATTQPGAIPQGWGGFDMDKILENMGL